MHPFTLERPRDLPTALALLAQAGRNDASAEYIAGGTDMVQLLQENVRRPERLVSLAGLLDTRIDVGQQGLRIGAAATMAEVAAHPAVVEQFSVISEALLNSASPQVRNQATMGGNLLQRTRCPYFRDIGYAACNKRAPGSGCSAIEGDNRTLAILGTSSNCIATNPSDMNVALTALEATIHIQNKTGQREIPIDDFFVVPGSTPQRETVLEPGDLITYVTLPASRSGTKSVYLKLRDRASYEFALASAAVVADVVADKFTRVRIALGGVGTKPWRSREAEQALEGRTVDQSVFREAAVAALRGARPQSENGFKIELAKRCLAHALTLATKAA